MYAPLREEILRPHQEAANRVQSTSKVIASPSVKTEEGHPTSLVLRIDKQEIPAKRK